MEMQNIAKRAADVVCGMTIALALVGIAFMLYLLSVHYEKTPGAVCNFGAGFSCQIVNQSIYSDVRGIPLSALGLVYFAVVAVLAMRNRGAKEWNVIALFSIFSLAFGIYLSGIERLVLHTLCVFCEGSKLLMIGILALAAARLSSLQARLKPQDALGAVAAGIAFAAITYYIQTTW